MPAEVPGPLRHRILSLARPEAFVPMARSILARIGYAILSPEEWDESDAPAEPGPALSIVEQRQLGEPGVSDLASTPLIVLSTKGGKPIEDRRVVGVVARPAGLHELYRLFQQVLEPIARRSLRALTNLPVRLRCAGREWQGALLSLSENGCLVRSPEPLALGSQLELAFELPRARWIEIQAETTYQLLPDTGLVFQATPPASRRAIQGFVEEILAA